MTQNLLPRFKRPTVRQRDVLKKMDAGQFIWNGISTMHLIPTYEIVSRGLVKDILRRHWITERRPHFAPHFNGQYFGITDLGREMAREPRPR